MRRTLTLMLTLTLVIALFPQPARAQTPITFDTLEINLWPEYDKPSMLVVYIGSLPANSWPTTLTFRIPKSAGSPFQAAVYTDDRGLVMTEYTYKIVGNYIVVEMQVTTQVFQLEYYDPLTYSGSKRDYDFSWPGDYAVKTATIVVRQPLDATRMEFVPPGDVSSHTNTNDLTDYTHPVGELKLGQSYAYSLSYQKTTSELTTDKVKVEIAGGNLPKSMWIRTLPWAFGFVALLVIAGGVWFFWRSGQPEVVLKKRRRRRATEPVNVEAAAPDESGVYCHTCGRRAALNDAFCRSCGTKLRI